MKQDNIERAQSAELRGSFSAMQRAAQAAVDLAIQTNTSIVVMRDGRRVRVPAEELKRERARNSTPNANK